MIIMTVNFASEAHFLQEVPQKEYRYRILHIDEITIGRGKKMTKA